MDGKSEREVRNLYFRSLVWMRVENEKMKREKILNRKERRKVIVKKN
jgi:hypothetical protein